MGNSRKPYVINNKEYNFSNIKFRECFHNARKAYSQQTKEKLTGEKFKTLIEENYGISSDCIKKYFANKHWPVIDNLSLLAQALDCDQTDFLDEIPTKTEVSTMNNEYLNNDKKQMLTLYNEIVKNIDLLTEIKTCSIYSKRKDGVKSLAERGDELLAHLLETINQDSIFTTSETLDLLNKIFFETIEYIKYPAFELPARWEDYSTNRMQEIASFLSDGCNDKYCDYDNEEELSSSPIHKYLRELYPESEESFFSLLYSTEVLQKIYSIDLREIIRLIFLTDFSDMFN